VLATFLDIEFSFLVNNSTGLPLSAITATGGSFPLGRVGGSGWPLALFPRLRLQAAGVCNLQTTSFVGQDFGELNRVAVLAPSPTFFCGARLACEADLAVGTVRVWATADEPSSNPCVRSVGVLQHQSVALSSNCIRRIR
jgi:hypothetical protein